MTTHTAGSKNDREDSPLTKIAFEPRIAVVVPTLNSPPTLAKLLESIKAQTLQPAEVVIVAQGRVDVAKQIAQSSGLPNTRVIESATGLSKARNAGIAGLQSDWNIVATPDDDVWYEIDAFDQAARSVAVGYAAVSGKVVPEDSGQTTRLRFGDIERQLDKRSVWTSAIEAGFFLTEALVGDVGAFDEGLGLGAHTPWRSGEGTDLLLRGLVKGYRVGYNPLIQLTEATPTRTSKNQVARLRDYARGTGRVYRTHYGTSGQFLLVVRSFAKLALAPIRGDMVSTREAAAVLVGRLEGLIGLVRAPQE
jgi:glycosyltransferase involved in cell wall biosynthesis